MSGKDMGNKDNPVVEYKPMFHEWATVQPGMITVCTCIHTHAYLP